MPSITLISATPSFVTPEEHKDLVASTPASFTDIPPVLRHQEDDVAVIIDPPVDGFAEADCARGTLYIVESALAFVSATGRGFQVEYPSITLHAVSRAESGPSIYCQLDEAPEDEAANEDEDAAMRELRLIPKDPTSLDQIFESLSLCASLHPDTALDSDDDLGDDDAFVDADEAGDGLATFTGGPDEELSEVGRAALEYLESIIYDPHDQKQQEASPSDPHDQGEEKSTAVIGSKNERQMEGENEAGPPLPPPA